MKKVTFLFVAIACAMFGQQSVHAQEGSTFVCTGSYIIATGVDVVVTMQDFGGGAGSCVIRDVFGRTVLSVTGSTFLGIGTNGFQTYGGVVKYRTSDNYSARCEVGQIAEGPWAGQYSVKWIVGLNNRLGNLKNGTLVGRCHR
jgi:hypothetical protein